AARRLGNAVLAVFRPRPLHRRLAKIVALEVADALAAEDGGIARRLDAFGDGIEAEAGGQPHEVAQEELVVVALGDIANEGAVDFDGVDGKRLEMAQGGEAGAE